MCTTLKPQDSEFIRQICLQFANDPGELINILHQVQEHFGFLPPMVQQAIATELSIPVSKVYGVVTFYSLFTMTPRGRYPISICTGTACYVRGVEAVLDEFQRRLAIRSGETTPDGTFSLNCLRCVGACGLAPVVMVGDKIYPRVQPDQVLGIIAEYNERL